MQKRETFKDMAALQSHKQAPEQNELEKTVEVQTPLARPFQANNKRWRELIWHDLDRERVNWPCSVDAKRNISLIVRMLDNSTTILVLKYVILVFEVLGTKLKCTKRTLLIANETRQWIAAVGWKAHIKSEIHQCALTVEQNTQHRQTLIDRAAEAALAEEDMTDYAHLSASLSSVTPSMPERMISANEEAMW